MSINNLEKVGLIRQPQVEQAMTWLVENGPLHQDPELPHWMLRQRVRAVRVARLRRGLYLAPTPTGRLPGLPAVGQLLAPEGYLSFYGAITLHGLTDQDTALWAMATKAPQAAIRYGQLRLEFVPWPARVRDAAVQTLRIDRVRVRLATPVQAFSDCLEAPRYGPSAPELLHVLRDGLSLGKLSERGLIAHALEIDSSVLARRLGLLLELATGKIEPRLHAIATRSHDWTRFDDRDAKERDSRWRLLLPRSREDILVAAR